MANLYFGFKSLEQLKNDFAIGVEKLKDDEFLGSDGLPYCKNCKTQRYCYLEEEGIACRAMCECQEQEKKNAEQEEKHRKQLDTFRNNKLCSLLGKRYLECMFSTAKITENNKEAFIKFKKYVNNSKEAFSSNIGFYIYGDNSTGKTYLTACVCNELIYQGWKCVYTNLATILNEIRSSYDGNGMGECAILSKLQSFDFAFIDDIGKEFIAREYNSSSSKWAEQKLFEVINARYNAEKPTIFTSNYSISELASVLNLDKAIIERINEMSTRIIKLEGDDFRSIEREEKSNLAKKLGI